MSKSLDRINIEVTPELKQAVKETALQKKKTVRNFITPLLEKATNYKKGASK